MPPQKGLDWLCRDVWYVCVGRRWLRYFVKQVNNESWRQWNLIEWANVFGRHILVIVWRLVRYQSHPFLMSRGSTKSWGWAKNLLTDCFTHWLTRALSAEADWKACQLTTNRYLFFNFEKTFSSSNRKNLSFCQMGLLPDFQGEKVPGSGFPCVVGGGTLGWYQHNGVLVERKKGGTDMRTTVE